MTQGGDNSKGKIFLLFFHAVVKTNSAHTEKLLSFFPSFFRNHTFWNGMRRRHQKKIEEKGRKTELEKEIEWRKWKENKKEKGEKRKLGAEYLSLSTDYKSSNS